MTKSPKPDGVTRQVILDMLKRQGEQSAGEIAVQLSLTAMAVRLQMYELEKEGLVAGRSEPAGRGRPVKLWGLTEEAQRIFPDAHQGLAVELINSVEAVFGADGLKQLIDRHSATQQATYEGKLQRAKSIDERIKMLAELRSAEGYMAEAQQDGRDWLLIENHCPVCSAAKACTGLCANELRVFQELLGSEVSVTREEHILQGARRCTYRAAPKQSAD